MLHFKYSRFISDRLKTYVGILIPTYKANNNLLSKNKEFYYEHPNLSIHGVKIASFFKIKKSLCKNRKPPLHLCCNRHLPQLKSCVTIMQMYMFFINYANLLLKY